MVQHVRSGHSYRQAARRWRVSLATVALWVNRARGRRLDQVDWRDRPSGAPRPSTRTSEGMIAAIGRARRLLQRHDALGEHGPSAIRRYLLARFEAVPCERTIARWLAHRGWSGKERWRRPPPPKGWYLPEVGSGRRELDSCDIVEGLCLRGSRRLEAFNTVALWGGAVSTETAPAITTDRVIAALQARWQHLGCPGFLQCDNDPIFTGAHAQRRYLGRLVHWCLCVGVVPVFTPPAELGFQATIEAYNRRWQERVWRRWRHRDLSGVRYRSMAFVAACTARALSSRPQVAARGSWQPPTDRRRVHRIVLLRRLDANATLRLCAQNYRLPKRWAHRLVRCEIDVCAQDVAFYGLRRRDPKHQPLLAKRRMQLRLVAWSHAHA